MKRLKTLLFAFFACALASADRPSTHSVERLLEVLHVEQAIGPLQAQMKQMMAAIAANPQVSGENSESQKAEANRQFERLGEKLSAALTWDRLKPIYLEAYQETLSQEEVDALVEFYQTPIGRSIASKLPQATQAAGEKVQEQLLPVMAKLIAESQASSSAEK